MKTITTGQRKKASFTAFGAGAKLTVAKCIQNRNRSRVIKKLLHNRPISGIISAFLGQNPGSGPIPTLIFVKSASKNLSQRRRGTEIGAFLPNYAHLLYFFLFFMKKDKKEADSLLITHNPFCLCASVRVLKYI
jgi:hypothetical protein